MVFIGGYIGLVFSYIIDYIYFLSLDRPGGRYFKSDLKKAHQSCCIRATSSWNYKEIFTFLLRRDDAVWQNGSDLTVWGGLAVGAVIRIAILRYPQW